MVERPSERFMRIARDIILPKPFTLRLEWPSEDSAIVLRVGDPNGVDNVTGAPLEWYGRKWLLSPHMTDGEVVQTAWLALQVAMEHEARESFTYQGQCVFDPHFDINKLVELRARPDALREREPTPAEQAARLRQQFNSPKPGFGMGAEDIHLDPNGRSNF